jgi:hypothetical protein
MKRIRDFHAQSWSNPFFDQSGRPPGRHGWLLRLLNIFGFAAGTGLLVYVFAYSPFLRINKIEITGAQTIDSLRVKMIATQAMAGYDYFVIPRDHFFEVATEGIKNLVLMNFPGLRGVTIEKKFGKIIITVEEREPTYRLIVGDRSYLLDQDGKGLREAKTGEGDNLIALSDDSVSFASGASLLPAVWLNGILDLHKYFATQVGVRDQLFRLDRAKGNIETVTTEGWYAVIDPAIDIKSQLNSLSSALIGKFKSDERKKLLYIDVRFGDKIFYIWK